MKYHIAHAATLAEASYSSARIQKPAVIHSCKHRDVQAHVLQGGILLLPGSNSVSDYFQYNLRLVRFGHQRLKMSDDGAAKGASGTLWHQGFLAYSVEVFHWLKEIGVVPRFIIGHSLGAAAAQILSKSYNVPAIAFAAPRTKFSRGPVKHYKQCLIINRGDDPIPKVPSAFFHMGQVKRISPQKRTRLIAHSMKHYREIVDMGVQHKVLPEVWAGG